MNSGYSVFSDVIFSILVKVMKNLGAVQWNIDQMSHMNVFFLQGESQYDERK